MPGVPHHVAQRGNRRMDAFFTDKDRQVYLNLLREFGEKHGELYFTNISINFSTFALSICAKWQEVARGNRGQR